jgi:hypothetical protein
MNVIEPLVKGVSWTETGQFIVENDAPRIIHDNTSLFARRNMTALDSIDLMQAWLRYVIFRSPGPAGNSV